MATFDLLLENQGTDTVTIDAATFSDPAFYAASYPASIPPQGGESITVAFRPTAARMYEETLTLSNNSPTPNLVIPLSGQGALGPEIDVSPLSFSETLPSGSGVNRTLTLSNGGDYDLIWSAESSEAVETLILQSNGLQDSLDRLETRFAEITALIPNKFDFTEGVTGTFISDGGSEIYDRGNYLSNNLSAVSLPYSDGVITPAETSLGANGRYCTKKHPGLFVF
ncbi:MAG: hypothetical protein ACI9DF_003847 [Verrucomicrobiales bacterium]|jgi:hypothetical protein